MNNTTTQLPWQQWLNISRTATAVIFKDDKRTNNFICEMEGATQAWSEITKLKCFRNSVK